MNLGKNRKLFIENRNGNNVMPKNVFQNLPVCLSLNLKFKIIAATM